MCDICDKAKKSPTLKDALSIIATAMQQRANRGRACLDKTLDKLAGTESNGEDALDQETTHLKDGP